MIQPNIDMTDESYIVSSRNYLFECLSMDFDQIDGFVKLHLLHHQFQFENGMICEIKAKVMNTHDNDNKIQTIDL